MTILIVYLAGVTALLEANGPTMLDDQKPAGFEIRTVQGEVVLTSNDIVAYEWGTHTITLTSVAYKELRERVTRGNKYGLNVGIPFVVTIQGKEVYKGLWKTGFSSIGHPDIVIVIDKQSTDKSLQADQIRLDLGYPSKGKSVQNDARENQSVKQMLSSLKKLK